MGSQNWKATFYMDDKAFFKTFQYLIVLME